MSDSEDTLDLTGKPPKSEPEKPASTRKASSAPHRKSAGLEKRLEDTLARAGNALANRGPSSEARPDLPFNEELGAAIAEDSKAIAGGLVSLTTRVKQLRPPLLIFLEAFEPLLAFGRVIGIVLRRARQAREDAFQAAAEYEAEQAEPSDNGSGEPAAAPAIG